MQADVWLKHPPGCPTRPFFASLAKYHDVRVTYRCQLPKMLRRKQLKPQRASSSQEQQQQSPSILRSWHPALPWHTLSANPHPFLPRCCGTIYATSLSLGHAPRNETCSSWTAVVALSAHLSLSLRSFSCSLFPLFHPASLLAFTFWNCMQDLLRFKSFYVCRCQLLPHNVWVTQRDSEREREGQSVREGNKLRRQRESERTDCV